MVKRKGFSKDKFFFGYRAEVVFQQTFPKCKKLSKQADFSLDGRLVEIGRSRILERQIIVYFRKLFYNINKEYHYLKDHEEVEVLDIVKQNQLEGLLRVPNDKFFFIYFTKTMNNFVIFTYQDLLNSELKRKRDGEYYFNIKVPKMYKTMHLNKIGTEFMGLDDRKECGLDEDMFGVTIKHGTKK